MDHSISHIKPLDDVRRPKGAHRIEVFSPKLGRRLCLHNRAVFALWLIVETDPMIQVFCERPGFVQRGGQKELVQFWVRYADREELLLLAPTEKGDISSSSEGSTIRATASVRTVDFAELVASSIWTSNWERMLPLVVANRRFVAGALRETIARFVAGPTQLSSIEREFSIGDPILVRAAVFTLLHAGVLRAPILRTQTLSPATEFLPSERSC